MFSSANMRKGTCIHQNLPKGGGGRSVLTVRRPSPGNVSGRVKRDDLGRIVSHLRPRRMWFLERTPSAPSVQSRSGEPTTSKRNPPKVPERSGRAAVMVA